MAETVKNLLPEEYKSITKANYHPQEDAVEWPREYSIQNSDIVYIQQKLPKNKGMTYD